MQTNSNHLGNTLNGNELNLPSKGRGDLDWIKNQDPTICCVQESKRIGKHIPCKQNHERAGLVILITNKIGFKIKIITVGKEEHFIMTTRSIWRKDITIINVYVYDKNGSKYMKILILLSVTGRKSSQKIRKDTEHLNNTIKKIYLIDLYKTPPNKSRIYILLKCTWRLHQNIPSIGPKISLSMFKRIEIIQSVLLKHKRIKVEINAERNVGTLPHQIPRS